MTSRTDTRPSQDMSALWPHLDSRSFISYLTGGGGDPRVGSTRNGSSGGTISASSNNKSDSAKNLAGTFIPVAVLLGVCVLLFLLLRPRLRRVYAPRAIAALRAPEYPSPELPSGFINWVRPFFKTPDTFVLNHGSIDGFFFLRFLKVLRNICFGGCLIIWPVLLPLNATGGKGEQQLEILTMGNVADTNKFFAHVFISWIFFGFVLYMIVRECIYYVNLRQAYLSSPYYADRLSSRTVMLLAVPQPYLDERRLRKLYGEHARRIWVPRTSKALANMVKERDQTAVRLEKAEIELIDKANAARKKVMRKKSKRHGDEKPLTPSPDQVICEKGEAVARVSGHSEEAATVTSQEGSGSASDTVEQVTIHLEDDAEGKKLSEIQTQEQNSGHSQIPAPAAVDDAGSEYTHPYGLDPKLPDLRGSVAAQWLPAEKRPYHRPIGNFGRRVDTIRWTRQRLQSLNQQIFKLRKRVHRGDEGASLPAAFIEFDTQEAAQAAHQVVAHHRPMQMGPRLLGIRPDEVLWDSLRMSWWERIGRNFAMLCLITVAILFWSIPSAIVALVSNVSFLEGIPFLTWIKDLPSPILSFLQGFIPPVALSLFMALVPRMLRGCAAFAGVPTSVLVELFSQEGYFAFQVVQVFLITTLTQAASGSFITIIENPLGARVILAKNLPIASNFYLSYILIQCLANGALNLLDVFELIRYVFLQRISRTPRAQFKLWHRFRVIHWGGVFPVFANMGVIVLCYAIVAPIILIFAMFGMWFMHVVWKYNLTYVFDSQYDSKGLFYPRALFHLIIGLYMAEVCLIGLFGLNLAYPQMVLMVIFFVFTGLVHFSLGDAISPLLQNLPQTLAMEPEIQAEEKAALLRAEREATEPRVEGAAASYYDTEETFGDRTGFGDETEEEEDDDGDLHGPVTGNRGVRVGMEGIDSVRSGLFQWFRSSAESRVEAEVERSGVTKHLDKLRFWDTSSQDPNKPPSFLTKCLQSGIKWLHPEVHEDFVALRQMIPTNGLPTIDYPQEHRRFCNYLPPELWAPKPELWIPRDEARVSRQEVAHTRALTPISDAGAWLDDKGRLVVDMDAAPIKQPRLLL